MPPRPSLLAAARSSPGRRAWWIAAVLAGGLACRGVRPPGSGAGARLPPPFEEEASSRAELVDDLRAAIYEAYAARSSGFDDAWLELLARTPRLLLVGVGADDVIFGFSQGAAVRNRPFSERPAEWVSKSLDVVLSTDGTAAWTVDEVSYRILDPRGRVILPLRETSVYERTRGRWELQQDHLAYPSRPADVAAATGRRAQAKRVAPSTGDGAAPLRALLEDHLAGKTTLLATARTVVFGPGAWSVFRGVEAPTGLGAVLGEEVKLEPGTLRVMRSRSGTVGWGAGTVVAIGASYPAGVVLRVTWILEREGDEWRLAVLHVAPALTREALRTLVFGG